MSWPLLGNASLFTKFLFTIFVPITPPSQSAKRWTSSCFSIKRTSNRIANTQPKLRTTLQKARTNRIMNKWAFLNYGPVHFRQYRIRSLDQSGPASLWSSFFPELPLEVSVSIKVIVRERTNCALIISGVDQPSHRKIGKVCELCSGARV